MELFYLKFAFEMPALCRCNLCIKAMECVNSSFGASAILHRPRRRHFMYACKRAASRVYVWLSLIRIHCSHPPMKFKLVCIFVYSTVHRSKLNTLHTGIWQVIFHRIESNWTKHFLSSSAILLHKSIKCVQEFCTFFNNNLPRFFLIHASLHRQVIRPDRSDRWTLQIKFPQLRDAGIYECQGGFDKAQYSLFWYVL